jgi:hypothetical protein
VIQAWPSLPFEQISSEGFRRSLADLQAALRGQLGEPPVVLRRPVVAGDVATLVQRLLAQPGECIPSTTTFLDQRRVDAALVSATQLLERLSRDAKLDDGSRNNQDVATACQQVRGAQSIRIRPV